MLELTAIAEVPVNALPFWARKRVELARSMRAAAQNPVSSRLVGIRVGRMLASGWGLAGTIGAVAGMMAAPIVYLDPNMMSGILLYGFAGALLGGIDNSCGPDIEGGPRCHFRHVPDRVDVSHAEGGHRPPRLHRCPASASGDRKRQN
jgi:branched-chain amino acid transport system permease protein